VSQKTTIFFVRFDPPLFDGTLKRVIPTIAKETLSHEKSRFQSARIHYATLFGHWKQCGRPEITKGYVSINWNYCAGDVFTSQQTDGN